MNGVKGPRLFKSKNNSKNDSSNYIGQILKQTFGQDKYDEVKKIRSKAKQKKSSPNKTYKIINDTLQKIKKKSPEEAMKIIAEKIKFLASEINKKGSDKEKKIAQKIKKVIATPFDTIFANYFPQRGGMDPSNNDERQRQQQQQQQQQQNVQALVAAPQAQIVAAPQTLAVAAPAQFNPQQASELALNAASLQYQQMSNEARAGHEGQALVLQIAQLGVICGENRRRDQYLNMAWFRDVWPRFVNAMVIIMCIAGAYFFVTSIHGAAEIITSGGLGVLTVMMSGIIDAMFAGPRRIPGLGRYFATGHEITGMVSQGIQNYTASDFQTTIDAASRAGWGAEWTAMIIMFILFYIATGLARMVNQNRSFDIAWGALRIGAAGEQLTNTPFNQPAAIPGIPLALPAPVQQQLLTNPLSVTAAPALLGNVTAAPAPPLSVTAVPALPYNVTAAPAPTTAADDLATLQAYDTNINAEEIDGGGKKRSRKRKTKKRRKRRKVRSRKRIKKRNKKRKTQKRKKRRRKKSRRR